MRPAFPRIWLISAFLLWCLVVMFVGNLPAADWAYWRGPSQNGVSADTKLPASWSDDPKNPENFLWKAPFGCRSTPIVMNGRVYINNQVGKEVNEQERVMCLDAETGKVIWEKKFNVFHTDIVSVRLGWSHMAGDPATGNIYWHGTQGHFVCFDKDGKILWQRQMMEEDGRVSGYGGRLPSPIVAGDLVVIGMINSSWGDQSKGGNRFLAMNKRDGTPVWWSLASDKPGTYFSTPVMATIKGRELLITGGSDGGIHAMQVGTGKLVWSFVFCKGAINCSPAVEGTLVFANHGEESPGTNRQGKVICVDAAEVKDGQPKLVWEQLGVKAKYTSPLVHDGRVYIGDDVAKLFCFDALTGKKIWTQDYGRNAMASPVWGDGKIYISNKNGVFHILKPGDKECETLHTRQFSAEGDVDVETYGNVAIANGRVYVPTRDELYCLGTKDAQSGKVAAKTTDVKKGKPAQLSIYPCDVLTHPGKDVQFTLKVYDEAGNFLQEVTKAEEVKWIFPRPPAPPGAKDQPPVLQAEITGSALPAKLSIKSAPPAQQGYVNAEWNGLQAKARVRVAPTFPHTQDFEKVPAGAVPASWINCQGKFLVKELSDGNHVLGKVTSTSNAVIASGNCFLGTPEMTNYTIEADVLGGKVDKEQKGEFWMPDLGIGACRYTLALGGQTQTLRLTSWDAMPRVDEGLDFKWAPHTWYRLKLKAVVDNGKTTLHGKAWQWGQKEPEKWSIEYTDPTPNLEGSPFLYGYVVGHVEPAPGTEVYFDNVMVTPNKK